MFRVVLKKGGGGRAPLHCSTASFNSLTYWEFPPWMMQVDVPEESQRQQSCATQPSNKVYRVLSGYPCFCHLGSNACKGIQDHSQRTRKLSHRETQEWVLGGRTRWLPEPELIFSNRADTEILLIQTIEVWILLTETWHFLSCSLPCTPEVKGQGKKNHR